MENTIVYLIRHSIPEYKIIDGQRVMYGPDAPLAEEGRQKVGKLADDLIAKEGRPFDAIVSSPYKRAYETASLLAGRMGLAHVATERELRDTDSAWPGTPIEELTEIVNSGRLFDDPRTHETASEISDRMVKAFDQIVAAHKGQLIGIVSHGDPLRLLVYRLRHPDRELPSFAQVVQEMNFDMAQGLRLEIPVKIHES
jgi:broad specificity phosphatase PhoE